MEPALPAAQLAWPAPPGNGRVRGLILKHEAFDELEHQARYGMLPLSWGSLGRGPSTEDVYAAPLELLLVRQLADDEQAALLRFRYNRLTEEFAEEFTIRTAAIPGPCGLHHPNFWRDFEALPEAKKLNGALLVLAAAFARNKLDTMVCSSPVLSSRQRRRNCCSTDSHKKSWSALSSS